MLQMVGKQVAAATKAAKGRLSYRYNFTAFTYNQTGFRIADNKLYLSKIDAVRIVLHRQPVNIMQVTVCKKNGRCYAIATCHTMKRRYCTIRYAKPAGIDVGISKFAHDSDNHVVENPQFLTTMLKPLKMAHHRLSRRQVGSNSRKKAIYMLARLYERMNNKRETFCTRHLHTTAAAMT
jgi:putative transposase